jgi:hypothetical protein
MGNSECVPVPIPQGSKNVNQSHPCKTILDSVLELGHFQEEFLKVTDL